MDDDAKEFVGFIAFLLMSAAGGFICGTGCGEWRKTNEAIKHGAAHWEADPKTGTTTLIWTAASIQATDTEKVDE